MYLKPFPSVGAYRKGIWKRGENESQTALRELFEETGLTARLDTSRSAAIEYPVSNVTTKRVVFFLGEVNGIPRIKEDEISRFKWVSAEELNDCLFPDTAQACKTLLR